jgi:tetratricopeptide (TPR) repeat protein
MSFGFFVRSPLHGGRSLTRPWCGWRLAVAVALGLTAATARMSVADDPPAAGAAIESAITVPDSTRAAATLGVALAAPASEPVADPRPLQPVRATAAPARPPSPPGDLTDVDAWVAYKRAAHRSALPDEARLFYRRGLNAARSGQREDAVRLVRGAGELDPEFVKPHLTLATWSLVRDPSQSLLQYAIALQQLRGSFLLQVDLVANAAFFGMHLWFVSLLLIALAILVLRQAELRHMWEERLSRFITPTSARLWAVPLLLLPFAAGLGLALPAVVLLGLLWPVLRSRERMVFTLFLMTLAVTPLAGQLLGRFAMPLHVDREPYYGVVQLQNASWTPAREAELTALAAAHPDNPVVQFGLGWSARQGGHLAVAEAAYRRARTLWPGDARILNDLANVLVELGRPNEAIALYKESIQRDPDQAAVHFNLAQVYTRQFDYHAATDEAARASALDFELVKGQQVLGTDDGVLPLVDQWLSPRVLWSMVLEGGRQDNEPALPAAWRGHVETAGWLFPAMALVCAIGSLIVGLLWQRSMPLRPCHNCGRVVCRRCSQRRRELALCPSCAAVAARAESPEFSNVLLGRERLAVDRSHRLARTALATLLPGYGLLAFHRVLRAAVIVASAVLLSAPWFGITPPFSFQTAGGGGAVDSPLVTLIGWATLYAASILGYIGESRRAAARRAALGSPVRSRPTQASPVTAKAA